MPLSLEKQKKIKELVAQCRKSLLAQNTVGESQLNSLAGYLPQDVNNINKAKFLELIRKLLIDDKELSTLELFVSESDSDEAFFVLAMALEINSSVLNLNLEECHINAERAQVLAQALKLNSTLVELSLWDNYMGDNGAKSIAQALTVNRTLEKLYLGNNNIGDEGARAFAQALKLNSTLDLLSLRYNNVGDDGKNALMQAVLKNGVLTQLGLDAGLGLSDAAHQHLAQNKTNAQAREKESVLIRTQADFDKFKGEPAEGKRELEPLKSSVKYLCLIGSGGQDFLKLLEVTSSNKSTQSNTEGSENSANQLKNKKI